MLALLPLLGVLSAEAASYDPALTWQTLQTEHFEIHFHDGERGIALEVGAAAEEAWSELTQEIGTTPKRRVQVTLIDWTDSPNGYATIIPYNTIVIYVVSPEAGSTLDLYEDWWEGIVTHELTHVLHMATVNGVPRVARAVFGSIISTHLVSPGWITEGYATFEETRYTHGGRGRSAAVDMVKRAAVLEDRFPPLGNLEGFQPTPPGGNLRYLFGQDFMQFIADRTGSLKWSEWVQNYGASVPFFLQARRTFGASFYQLYREWKAELHRRYGAQKLAIEAEGLTPYTVVSPKDESCGAAAWRPDGNALAFGCSNLKTGSQVYLKHVERTPGDADPGAEGEGEKGEKSKAEKEKTAKEKLKKALERPREDDLEVILRDQLPSTITWRRDGKAFAFASSHATSLYRSTDDVFLYDVEKEDLDALTDGARARDPEFTPDGTRLLMVTNELATNQLATMTVDQQITPLTTYDDHTQLDGPRYSPDGGTLAVSVWQDGQRDLWLFDPSGRPIRRLTWDIAIDRDPTWSPDGRWLYFTSDRSGVPNLYALEVATDHLWQVTNVLTGAWGASIHPDGNKVAFDVFTTMGAEVAIMDLDPAAWKDRGRLQRWPLVGGPVTGGEAAIAAPGAAVREVPLEPAPATTSVGGSKLPEGAAATGAADGREATASEGTAEGADEGPPVPEPWKIQPYNPLPTLLPPRYWLPYAGITFTGDNVGLYGVAATSGTDALHYYGWSGYLTYRTDAQFLGGGASFALNRWRPVFAAGVSTQVTPYGDVYRNAPVPAGGPYLPGIESTRKRYFDRRIRGTASMVYPVDSYRSAYAYYSGTSRDSLDPLPADVYTPFLPTRGFFSSIGAGWAYGKSKSYALSISPEAARSLGFGVELTPFFLGSFTYDDAGQRVPFNQLQATGEWREYVTNPWVANHVLAWKLSGGGTLGDGFRYGSFALGGTWSEGGIAVVPDEWRTLRGFYPASDSGEWYWLGSAEYRLPIWYIERGLGVLPLFFRELSGTVLVDAGNAFDDGAGASLANSRIGVGAEVNLLLVAWYGAGVRTRVGYAFAAYGADGVPIGSLDGLYFSLGSSF